MNRSVLLLSVLAFVACSADPVEVDTDLGSDTGTGTEPDTGTDTEPDTEPDTFVDTGPDSDDDNDGMTENEGDCDDANPTVFAGAPELCDGIANDCGGPIDGPGLISTGGVNYPTLAAAVAAASSRATIGVCEGTYVVNLALGGDLTIWSPDGAALTTLSGAHTSSIFTVVPGASLTVKGITLKDGAASGDAPTAGGAIRALQPAAIALIDSVIVTGSADQGGGIYIGAGTLTLDNTSVRGSADVGGAIFARDASVTCSNHSEIQGSAASGGGGMYAIDSTIVGCDVSGSDATALGSATGGGAMLVDSTWTGGSLSNNSSAYRGGGAMLRDSTLVDVAVVDNAAMDGGGLFISGAGTGNSTVTSSAIARNSALETGGAVVAFGPTTWTDVTFDDNSADTRAGGMYATLSSTQSLVGAEFRGNSAESYGGALYANDGAVITLTRSTVAESTSQRGAGIYINGTDSVVNVVGGQVYGNIASSGGGGARVNGGRLVSTGAAWGVIVANSDDVYVDGLSAYDYADTATFACTLAGCSPTP